MTDNQTVKAQPAPFYFKKILNHIKQFFSKSSNCIIVFFGIVLTITVIYPLFSMVKDSFTVQSVSEADLGCGRKARRFYVFAMAVAVVQQIDAAVFEKLFLDPAVSFRAHGADRLYDRGRIRRQPRILYHADEHTV